jgi:TusA-related sulfurtransferase
MRSSALAFCLLLALPASAKDATDPDDMQGKKELYMMNCPSAVAGARSRAESTPDGVVVVVTAQDDAARQEIRRRAHVQEEVALQPERGAIEHTGLGTGSGRYGHCPGLIENTTLDVQETPEGVRLIVKADRPADVARLQKSTRARIRALAKLRRVEPR